MKPSLPTFPRRSTVAPEGCSIQVHVGGALECGDLLPLSSLKRLVASAEPRRAARWRNFTPPVSSAVLRVLGGRPRRWTRRWLDDGSPSLEKRRQVAALHSLGGLNGPRSIVPGNARGSRESAFTLVEIALSIAIIGFALVAIIGVLPAGLNVQKENREETIVVHDANYFIDAIRSGARGLDDLTNYVEAITNYVSVYEVDLVNNTTNLIDGPDTDGYTYQNSVVNSIPRPANADVITNGLRIIGLLSTPKYIYRYPDIQTPMPNGFTSNYVIAYVRALSGPAVEKAPQTNATVLDLGFRYRLISELSPYANWNTNWFAYTSPDLTPQQSNDVYRSWQMARTMQNNTRELRLTFRWPINSRREAGNQRQVFRTLVGGALNATNHRGSPIWLMSPEDYRIPGTVIPQPQ